MAANSEAENHHNNTIVPTTTIYLRIPGLVGIGEMIFEGDVYL
jgi:hypothetical protein